MSDTTLHELCKGFGALLSRSKVSILVAVNACLIDGHNCALLEHEMIAIREHECTTLCIIKFRCSSFVLLL